MRLPALALAIALALVISPAARAQFSAPPVARAQPRRADVKHIACQVCRRLGAAAFAHAGAALARSTPAARVDEAALIDAVERMATSWRDEGAWIKSLHLEARGRRLRVVDKAPAVAAECGEACRTLEAAADAVVGRHDTDMAEALYARRFGSAAAFSDWLCGPRASGACAAPEPELPAGHAGYPAWAPAPPGGGGQDIDRVLGQMQDQGLKGKVYSRDDLMRQMAEGGGMGGMGGDDEL